MMKARIMLSVIVILFVVVASLGATMAWFTDTAELSNEFTAGTLEINAVDEWQVTKFGETETSDEWDNANPGECQIKEFTITNNGTKKVYVRFNYDGEWTVIPDEELDPANADDTLVTILPVDLNGWTFLEVDVNDNPDGGYWYYNGVLPADDDDPATEDHILKFEFEVCLDGPDTGNEYQGATYKIDFDFYAVQATHYASFDLWYSGYYAASTDDAWYEVEEVGDDFIMPDNTAASSWVKTEAGEPNYVGWTYPTD